MPDVLFCVAIALPVQLDKWEALSDVSIQASWMILCHPLSNCSLKVVLVVLQPVNLEDLMKLRTRVLCQAAQDMSHWPLAMKCHHAVSSLTS